jgi:hypothetical protein
LAGERVDDGPFGLWRFGEVSQEADYTLKFVPVLAVPLIGYSGHQFAQHDQIDDDACGQQTVFADVVADKVLPAHEDLAGVLIDGLLGISGSGDVLDDNGVVGVFLWVSGVVEEGVLKDVFDAFGLGSLLGLELFL